MSQSMLNCPACLGPVVPVSYGLPTQEAFNDPNFHSGGCSIEIGQGPMYFCRSCAHELPESLVKTSDWRDSDMGEGEIHAGPGGYEGMGYSGGYAADYFDESDEH